MLKWEGWLQVVVYKIIIFTRNKENSLLVGGTKEREITYTVRLEL